MSKSIKLKNDKYWDSKSITHNQKLLSDILYPIGSIYMSVNSTSPATLFGGTWEQISGRFLYCTNTSKTTGGAESVNYTPAGTNTGTAITVDQMPSHSHLIGKQETGIAGSSGDATATIWWKSDSGIASTSVGGGKTHTHTFNGTKTTIKTMPPYFTVYCWYRTA